LSPAFVSDLSALIEEFQPAAWVFGHTHHNIDEQVGSTRIVTNQRGYPDELSAGFRPDRTIDV
jgi:Icc-related predicted phosphoesterase